MPSQLRVRGRVTRVGRREHRVRLHKPIDGVRDVIVGYMAGITDLEIGQEVDWPECTALSLGPSAIFISEVK